MTRPGRPASLLAACTMLTAVVLAAFPVVAWVGYWHSGPAGVEAAAVAAGVCWAGALAALLVAGWCRHGQHAVSGLLAGMLFRMGVPLVAGCALHFQGGRLDKAHVFIMILAYYFVTLVTETILSLRLVASAKKFSA